MASSGTRDDIPKFTPTQLAEYARAYIDAVKSNQPYEWADIAPNARNKHEYSKIRRIARKLDPTITAPVNGRKHADFSGHIYEHNGQALDHVALPREHWGRSMDTQERYLNTLVFGEGNQGTPNGWVWHHHQDQGRMQLVRYGIHSATDHVGGAAEGAWSAGTK